MRSMTKLEKIGAIFGLITAGANLIVVCADAWEKISPKIKPTFDAFLAECKKISKDSEKSKENKEEPKLIEVIEK